MKVPFRNQATEFDCVPSSATNSLCYLFSRAELPPAVLKHINSICLDHPKLRGTSSQAIYDMGEWLNEYKDKRYPAFSVAAEYLNGEDVHLHHDGPLIRCLEQGGIILICVHTTRFERHCMLALRYGDGWLYCHEPYLRTRRFISCDDVQFITETGPQTPNIKIRRSWLEKDYDPHTPQQERKYTLGEIFNRECLLLQRIRST